MHGLEAIADATYDDDAIRIPDLAPQRRDVDVERLRRAPPVLVPDFGDDVVAPNHHAGILGELREEIELFRREGDLVSGDLDTTCTPIDRQRADALRRRIAVVRRPPVRAALYCCKFELRAHGTRTA